MSLVQRKNVKWSEDQRLDVDDMTALSDLKDNDLRQVFEAMFEPGVNGLVFKGFAGQAGTGLQWQLLGADSVGIDADGNLVEMLASSPLTVALPANASCYIHAYVVEQDSDSDVRRFLNDIVSPPEEFSSSAPTRLTKTVALYVTSNADATLLQASFQTSAFLAGKTRKLISLAACKTNATNVIASSEVDFRNTWMVAGNQIPTLNGGINALPFTFGTSNGERNVNGVRTMFRGLASVLRELGSASTQNWWDTSVVRTDAVNGAVSPTTQARLSAVKSVEATVHPTVGRAEFTSLATAVTGLTSGTIHLKPGTHVIPATIDFANKSDIVIQGDSANVTGVKFENATTTFSLGANARRLTFRGLRFYTLNDGTATLTAFITFAATTVQDILFEDCEFGVAVLEGALKTSVGAAGTRIRFSRCRFEFGVSPGVFAPTPRFQTSDVTEFVGCTFLPTTAGANVGGEAADGGNIMTNVRFRECTFGAPLGVNWSVVGMRGNLLSSVEFDGCDLYEVVSLVTTGVVTGGHSVQWQLTDCRILNTGSTSALVHASASNTTYALGSRVRFKDCEVQHNGIVRTASGGRAPAIEVDGCILERLTGWSAAWFDYADCGVQTHPTSSSFLRIADSRIFYGSGTGVTFTLSSSVSGTGIRHVAQFHNVEWSAGTTRAAASEAVAAFALSMSFSASAALTSSGCSVIMHRNLFRNVDASQLPLQISKNANGGEGNLVLDYTWSNGADGAGPTDTGLTGTFSAPARASDSPYRLLAF
jgi:hypothetical protein